MDNFSEFESMQNFLFELRNAGSKFSLQRIEKLCKLLGNPQQKYSKIHIAGTNGKGSTCAVVESILRASGLKTGMFTSPHLLYLGERVQVDRIPISKFDLLRLVAKIRSVADEVFSGEDKSEYPSFFEFMTALAFIYFAEQNVDVAIIEVGLGGRLDSTNIITADVCAITSIALDHTEFLGNTITDIATEKAGIIKNNIPVVVGNLPFEALQVIEKISEEKNAPLYKITDIYPSKNEMPRSSLKGDFQRINAGVAVECARALQKVSDKFSCINEASISKGLATVIWEARWQKINLSNGATLILDASHNPEGASALESNLQSLKNAGIKPVIAVGVLGQERAKALLKVISKYARKIVLLVPNQPRALQFDVLESFIDADVEILRANVNDIFFNNICSLVSEGETIVSTGSIYLAGEVLGALKSQKADGLSDIFKA
ncbi:MAG: bifunctional folylpolyglutamate synthase/dihydrofolate synthase [Verrucomicrobiaceae bacterium]|nr:bifunctional folylpolyglutamate synthase/dihydrofolate synthase [Verrucomicrobiaceae bacterium]